MKESQYISNWDELQKEDTLPAQIQFVGTLYLNAKSVYNKAMYEQVLNTLNKLNKRDFTHISNTKTS